MKEFINIIEEPNGLMKRDRKQATYHYFISNEILCSDYFRVVFRVAGSWNDEENIGKYLLWRNLR